MAIDDQRAVLLALVHLDADPALLTQLGCHLVETCLGLGRAIVFFVVLRTLFARIIQLLPFSFAEGGLDQLKQLIEVERFNHIIMGFGS